MMVILTDVRWYLIVVLIFISLMLNIMNHLFMRLIFCPFKKFFISICISCLVSLIFLKKSLVFLILLFSSISLHWLLRKAFLSLLAILWNSAFKWEYLFFSPLLFASLLFTAICKTCSDRPFAFLHFFSIGMVLIPVSCTMSWTSAHYH